jgi:hypothetical protein
MTGRARVSVRSGDIGMKMEFSLGNISKPFKTGTVLKFGLHL